MPKTQYDKRAEEIAKMSAGIFFAAIVIILAVAATIIWAFVKLVNHFL